MPPCRQRQGLHLLRPLRLKHLPRCLPRRRSNRSSTRRSAGLQSGAAPAAAPAADATAASATAPSPHGTLPGLARVADAVVSPLAVVARVADMPFRWVPPIVKHLLGYVAIGTTLMAGALWYYILAIRSH